MTIKLKEHETTPNMSGYADFFRFLEANYGFHHITAFDCVNNTTVNRLFLAETKEGGKVLIKKCDNIELCANEHERGKELYNIDPRHFVEQMAYCTESSYSFTAQAYMPGKTLSQVLKSPSLLPEERATMIEELYSIFLAMKKSDVVHRDIHLENVMLHDGRLLLIDFQIAVSKKNYQELTIFQKLNSLADWRGAHIYSMIAWDDAHTILLLLKEIGSHPTYEDRYRAVEKEIESHIGKDTIWYRLPSRFSLHMRALYNQLKLLVSSKHKRTKYEKRIKTIKQLILCWKKQYAKKTFPSENDFIRNFEPKA